MSQLPSYGENLFYLTTSKTSLLLYSSSNKYEKKSSPKIATVSVRKIYSEFQTVLPKTYKWAIKTVLFPISIFTYDNVAINIRYKQNNKDSFFLPLSCKFK